MGRRRNRPEDLLGVGSRPPGLLHKFSCPAPTPQQVSWRKAPRSGEGLVVSGGGQVWIQCPSLGLKPARPLGVTLVAFAASPPLPSPARSRPPHTWSARSMQPRA